MLSVSPFKIVFSISIVAGYRTPVHEESQHEDN
jgi:hypothetical protein